MKKILIVEDNKETREMLAEILKTSDYDVMTAENGRFALEVLEAGENPDIIIMDVRMPEMDGLQASKLIRENPKTKNIPILFSSIFRDIQSAAISGLHNCDFLEKPYKPEKLLEKIKILLSK